MACTSLLRKTEGRTKIISELLLLMLGRNRALLLGSVDAIKGRCFDTM
jgi:hypothetical protein